jgi:hypothetical protein
VYGFTCAPPLAFQIISTGVVGVADPKVDNFVAGSRLKWWILGSCVVAQRAVRWCARLSVFFVRWCARSSVVL